MGKAVEPSSTFIGSRAHAVSILREVNRIIEEESPMMSVGEVARRIGVSAKTVKRMVDDGRLKATNIGRKKGRPVYRIRQIELEALIRPGQPVAGDVSI